ncbi:MAG: hypothetical protein KF823_08725 [Xanthomonadales bacterium]|nr:hypothetical protein [Xanthomonadales bacterium]
MALLSLAAAFVLLGLSTIATHGWTEIYADQWRLYPIYLEQAFPANVLALENGHRPVFPGLVRVAELHLLDGNQKLQLAVGGLLALATVLVLAFIAWRDARAGLVARALATALAAFAVFWLGNARMLLHGNESVHAYLLTACLAGGIALVLRDPLPRPALGLAALLAFIATFSFGPGMATFPALALVLVLQRRYRPAVWMGVALLATLLLYFALPGATGVRNSLQLRPFASLLTAATWLASMPVNLFDAAFDPDAGRSLPSWLRAILQPIAQGYRAHAGDIRVQHGPATALGLFAMATLLWATFTTWRDQANQQRLRLAGLALAWFGAGVAVIVALGRLGYFQDHPDQMFAHRYLPWSCLFWLGWFWVVLGRSGKWHWPFGAGVAIASVLMLGMGLATSTGYRIWGELIRDGLRVDSAGIAMGHLVADRPQLGESHVEHIEAALPAVRGAGISMFAWPESKLLGSRIPVPTTPGPAFAGEIETANPVANRLDSAPSLYLEIRMHAVDAKPPGRLLVLDGERRVVGMVVRGAAGGAWRYRGFARVPSLDDGLVLADRNGSLNIPLAGAGVISRTD